MKYLGIDYGTKRIGLAVSDPTGTLAFPKDIIDNDEFDPDHVIRQITEICQGEKIEVIVVGESLDFHNQPNKVMKEIHEFVKKLGDESKLLIHLEPEFMTSQQARRIRTDLSGYEMGKLDASAAAIILQSFLDKSHNA